MKRQLPMERIESLSDPVMGLTEEEVIHRRNRYGDNNILDMPGSSWIDLLQDTLRDPMLWFLVITSSVFVIIGDYREAIILTIAIVPLAGMDAYLHRRTQVSTATLGGRLANTAKVIRNDVKQTIASIDLVPGDLIEVAAGEYFPADGVIMDAQASQVDESALTGEAFPVRKEICNVKELDGKSPEVDSSYWGMAGTRLLTGNVRLRVIYTGKETYYGEIVDTAIQGQHEKTPLQRAIASLVAVLLVVAAILCVVVGLVRWIQGFGLVDAVVSAMTLAVAALPEEFPVVFTFFLGMGVYRLAKRQALVRRAVAVENIGRITNICSDKTGTLTEGRLILTHVVPVEQLSEKELLYFSAVASRPDSDDPLDRAILQLSGDQQSIGSRLFVYPFTEDRKKETAIVRIDEDEILIAVKGAPEVILNMCSLEPAERQNWIDRAEEFASSGHKLIACARQTFPEQNWAGEEPVSEYIFAGLLALEDPVRDGIKESVNLCQGAGIHIIMITGDHPLTARAVASEIGLGKGNPRVYTADQIEESARGDRPIELNQVDVIARSIPSQKHFFVKQLQQQGEVVAVTGDGVNDVPALQVADVGIAMGERGTQAAREVASIVLLDDNFRTIVGAMVEGDRLFQNLRLSFAYLLMIHIPLVISAAVIPLAGYPLLYLPVHIVWLELIIHPTALLVFQNVSAKGLQQRRKKDGVARFFDPSEWFVVAFIGGLLTVLTVMGYIESLGSSENVEHARAMVLACLSAGSALMAAILSRLATRTAIIVVVLTLLSAVILIQVPLLSSLLHMKPLHLNDWFMAVSGSVLVMAILGFSSFCRKQG